MEVVKNVASICGCIISLSAVATLLLKPLRNKALSFVKTESHEDETSQQLQEIKEMIALQAENNKAFQDSMSTSMDICLDFTEKQCRSILKSMFYKYRDTQVLPLYEKKTLMDLEDLYINKLHKNHWGKTLVEVMNTWEVDSSDIGEQDFE